jgi:hypothetical protein
MSIDMAQAFTIFSGITLGQAEAFTAKDQLTPEELTEYDQHVEVITNNANAVGQAAYAEIGKLSEIYGLHLLPENKAAWTVQDWRHLLDAIENSEFEQIHLTNAVGASSAKALLELVKP